MNRVLTFLRDRHEEIFKIFLFLLCIAILVYLFPREGKFRYEIGSLKGKPWPYENLMAQFDFPIYKSKEDISAERENIKKKARPYFRVETGIANSKKEEFIAGFENSFRHESGKTKDKLLKDGLNILDSLYGKGIIQIPDSIRKLAETDPGYRLFTLSGSIEEEKTLNDFFTVKSADDYVSAHVGKYKGLEDTLINILENCITHNVTYDPGTTRKFLNEALAEISPTKGGRVKGESVIYRGEIVTPERYAVLESLQKEYETQTGGGSSFLNVLLGQTISVTICLILLATFLYLFRKDILADINKIIFLLLLMTLMVLMNSIALRYNMLHYYLLPFCILPIIIRTFYDTRLALFVHLMTTLINALIVPAPFEFCFIELAGGIAAIFSIVSMRRRSQIFVSSALIFAAYALSYTGFALVHDTETSSLSTSNYISFAVSAALTLFSYPLIYVFERTFGFVSDVTLMEISDTNSLLLRELASKAPGTFQHSLQVADLAEEIVREIGGNTLLARTGALYHDIGKMDMPVFFIENQMTGVNPHEELEFEESARIIISHVIRGIEKARKNAIPEQVIDFIRTHHGTTTTGFFYRSYRLVNPEGDATEKDFQYPGPLPYSKETAALMLADATEASARALKKHDAETLDNHVENIVNALVAQNQFVNADITFKDITITKKILKKKLANIYHQRIEYPK